MVPGGAWIFDDRFQSAGFCKRLARHGDVTMNSSYRRLPDWRFPALLEDLQQALCRIQVHAGENRIDYKRMVTSRTAPRFLYSGTTDDLVPRKNTEEMRSALNAAGVSTEVLWIGGRGHPMPSPFDPSPDRAALDILDTFMGRDRADANSMTLKHL